MAVAGRHSIGAGIGTGGNVDRGSRRIAFELGSRMTVCRILIRHGLMTPKQRPRGTGDLRM